PTEVAARVAARGLGGRTLVIFQPHRYSRTAALREEFGRCFGDADRVWILDVYAAGEAPIEGATGESLAESAKAAGARHVTYASDAHVAAAEAAEMARSGDTVITLGAGDITKLGDEVLAHLRRNAPTEGVRR
ncbi:MAG TPA: UDP-N-acetylmuramate--L-alanine ligase, partial [Planctomycetota bacterium]|nr:UDP-N-acetylmuramate--L-alanine ligase [Planctomycetota bacterium]